MRLLTLLLLSAAPAVAAPPQSLGTITQDVPIRGVPKGDGAEVGMLAKGAGVVVHHEEGDWYAVQPPRGSISWINHKFLELGDKSANYPKNGIVHNDGDVKLAVGKAGVPKPLDLRKTAVPEGTIVLVIGAAVTFEGDQSKWYPILPPEDDFRYLPKAAVQVGGPVGAGFVVASPANAVVPLPTGVPAAVPNAPAGKPAGWPNHPTWQQAVAAEQAGDFEKAERLFFQLAREMNGPGGDSDLANLCFSRVHALRERKRQGPPAANGVSWNAATGTDRITAKPAEMKREADPAVVRVSEPAPRREKDRDEDVTPRDRTAETGQWTGSGRLRLAGFKVAGRQAYALEDSRGKILFYAIAAAGFDLEKNRNKAVDLFGTVSYPKDLRGIGLVDAVKADAIK